jgi:RNA polymerase sigma-70 factor (ECF subfamily)
VTATLERSTVTDDDVLALYARTVDEVYCYASRLAGGDRSWADELVQETYLHLLQRARRGDVPAAVDTGWLIVSCRHRFLDELKRQRRRQDRELRAMPRATADADAGPALEALDRLPVDQRTVLVLKYIDEMSVGEIGREIGRSVHATESLLARARTALRAQLTKGAAS